MKTTIAKKLAYTGAGAGLVLFALFGLLPGSLIGGAAGVNIAGWIFGLPLEPGIISRALVLAGMLAGVLVAGIVIVTATSTVGWLVGRLIETAGHAKIGGIHAGIFGLLANVAVAVGGSYWIAAKEHERTAA